MATSEYNLRSTKDDKISDLFDNNYVNKPGDHSQNEPPGSEHQPQPVLMFSTAPPQVNDSTYPRIFQGNCTEALNWRAYYENWLIFKHSLMVDNEGNMRDSRNEFNPTMVTSLLNLLLREPANHWPNSPPAKTKRSFNELKTCFHEHYNPKDTSFSPIEKLFQIRKAFHEINLAVERFRREVVQWCMDDLFPLFLFVVIRSRIQHLGAEINFINELTDKNMEMGELAIMFTTLKLMFMFVNLEFYIFRKFHDIL
ncbi:hypothetical protein HELRODRAFT_164305 [Helobdella robusta]|uniref:VPS9 domain-containing protein n=1 Tax=Helobdella robusta TaxID=6412 RepID=T1EV89_HELRO|nr:hypothetical protein HELRODRAFT_164305 [Helobdella robusta]ESN94459.1 hypothetical protein HELRODRAFT_164305 [Helobdella robusta]